MPIALFGIYRNTYSCLNSEGIRLNYLSILQRQIDKQSNDNQFRQLCSLTIQEWLDCFTHTDPKPFYALINRSPSLQKTEWGYIYGWRKNTCFNVPHVFDLYIVNYGKTNALGEGRCDASLLG